MTVSKAPLDIAVPSQHTKTATASQNDCSADAPLMILSADTTKDALFSSGGEILYLHENDDAATILVDLQLRISYFSAAAGKNIKLIPGDIGRAIGYIANLLNLDELATEVQTVLSSLTTKQVNIQTRDGLWYSMRMFPYCTKDQTLQGVALNFIDVTGIKRIQTELQNSLHLSRSILDCCPDLVYVYDMSEQRNIYTNREIETFLGYTSGQIKALGSSMFARLLHPDDMQMMLSAQEKMRQAKDGDVHDFEFRMKHADGSWRHLRERDTVFLRDELGAVQQILGFATDITEYKQAKEKLRASEHFTKAIANNIPAMVGYWDKSLHCRFSNKEYVHWFGRSEEQMQGIHIRDLMGDELFQKNEAYIHAVLRGEDQRFERQLIRQNGEIAHFLAHYVAHQINGEILGFFSLVTDISAIKNNQMALKLNDLAMKNISQGVIITDAARLILSVNDAFVTMTGYSKSEIIGRNCRFLQGPLSDAATAQEIRDALSKAVHFSGKILNYRKGGIPFWNELSISPVCDEQGTLTHFIGITRDITEKQTINKKLSLYQHNLEDLVTQRTAELASARRQADSANNAKSRFLAAASHDLRQPLAALDLYVGVLKARVSPANLDLVANIQSCVGSLSALLTDLLDISKLEAGVVTPKQSDFSIDEVLDKIVLVNRGAAERKKLHMRVHQSGIVVRTDQQLLHRIIGNLVDNAVKHTDKGGILIACRRHEGRLWLQIWDTGRGIPEDKTELIFEEFRQLGDEARNRGSGLGLAIVAKTAALLGLQIRLRSQPGRGSMFALELPQGVQPSPQTEKPALHKPRPIRIALVEDNLDVLQALTMALQTAGHEVVSAQSGKQLQTNLDWSVPDMVISDYRLGAAETGFHVISEVRKIFGEDLPALLITGDTDPSMVRNMADQGITVQYKPLQLDRLLTYINSATESRRSNSARIANVAANSLSN